MDVKSIFFQTFVTLKKLYPFRVSVRDLITCVEKIVSFLGIKAYLFNNVYACLFGDLFFGLTGRLLRVVNKVTTVSQIPVKIK